jgi:sarcosine oxidase subunit alpha
LTFRPPPRPSPWARSRAGARRSQLNRATARLAQGRGAYFRRIGHWRRAIAFNAATERSSRPSADHRESLGLLDASAAGGSSSRPDAGKFLDMLYTNMVDTLPLGKCRYGLMYTKAASDRRRRGRADGRGHIFATTTGGASRIYGIWRNGCSDGGGTGKSTPSTRLNNSARSPWSANARKVLEKLGGMDVLKEALGFMEWADNGSAASTPASSVSPLVNYSYEMPCRQPGPRAFWDAHDAWAAWSLAQRPTAPNVSASLLAPRRGFHHDQGQDRRYGHPAGSGGLG